MTQEVRDHIEFVLNRYKTEVQQKLSGKSIRHELQWRSELRQTEQALEQLKKESAQ